MARSARSIARVELARGRLEEFDRRMAGGMEWWAMEVLNRAKVPDQPLIGQGLVERGGFISYVYGKRVGGDADRKPKTLRVGKGTTVAVGYSFPARFNEMGTVHQPPRPFFLPAVVSVVGDSGVIYGALAEALKGQLRSRTRKFIRTNLRSRP